MERVSLEELSSRSAALPSAEKVMQRLRCWADVHSHPSLGRCRAMHFAKRTHNKVLQRSWHGNLLPLPEVLKVDWPGASCYVMPGGQWSAGRWRAA